MHIFGSRLRYGFAQADQDCLAGCRSIVPFIISQACKKISAISITALYAVLLFWQLPFSDAYAGTHSSGTPATGLAYWGNAGSPGGSCYSCHGATPSDASFNAAFATSFATIGPNHALSYYATNPANIKTGVDAESYMGSSATSGTNAYNAVTNEVNLSAYFASLMTPVLTNPGASTWASGASYSYQIVSAASSDYLVSSTTYSASGLPSGVTINTSSGLVSGTLPSVSTPTNYSITLNASNAAAATTTGSVSFTLTINPPAPTVTARSPITGPASGGTSVTITGTNFSSSSTLVYFGGTAASYSLTDTTHITATAPVHAAGTVDITVANPGGTSATSASDQYTYVALPTITGISPTSGPGAGGTSVVITGTNLTAATAVQFGGTSASSFTVNSATQITAVAPAGTAGNAVQVTATTVGGTSATSSADNYTYGLAPVVSVVSPASGLQTGGNSVSITGNNFTGTTAVSFGGSSASFSFIDSSHITATAPARAAGAVDITVTTTTGGVSSVNSSDLYTYLAPPVINSATTASGSGGSAFSYQLTATYLPTSFTATGLPAGVSLNTTTGLISGTPTVNGIFTVNMSASNAAGTGLATLTITLTATLPVITSAITATGSGGSPFSYQITASNIPSSYSASGLPAGVTVNGANGLISGTPTVNGVFVVTLGASNAAGSASKTLTITLTAIAPVITSANTASGNGGAAFSYQITANNLPSTFAATGLPTGVTVNTTTGLVSGTPAKAGIFNATVSATNGAGTGSQALLITLGTLPTVAATATMAASLNAPTILDLASSITGTSVTGVTISSAPAHGTVTANGTKVTYTPVKNYFGTDAFSYIAYGSGGASPPGTVTVTIIERPDPTKDAAVAGLLGAQEDSAQRFAGTQISNFQRRMETLHSGRGRGAEVSQGGEVEAAPTLAMGAKAEAALNQSVAGNSNTATNNNPLLHAAVASRAYGAADTTSTGGAVKSVQFNSGMNNIVALLTTQSLNLASLNRLDANGTPDSAAAANYWVEGIVTFGTRDATGTSKGFDFTTSGISIGADRGFSDKLTLGVGFGFASDRTNIGNDGSRSNAQGSSFTVYGSYKPRDKFFVDGLLGYGTLNFDTRRYVAAVNDFALGSRDGYQLFSSLASGYEYRDEGVLVSPYARLDYAVDHLNQSSETGAGLNALTYFSQDTPSVQGALGIRAEAKHETSYGSAIPRIRAEYRHEFQGERQASVAYADLIGGSRYNLSTGEVVRDSFMLGIGNDFVLHSGLSFGLDYQLQHSLSSNDASQSIMLKLSKVFDKHDILPAGLLGIQVDAGYTFDDNVTRAKESADIFADRIYSADVSKAFVFPLTEHGRALLSGSVGGEKFDRYTGLSHVMTGVQGEYQYRQSAEFSPPTYAVFANAFADQYESDMRDGYHYAAGVTVRKPLTDRILFFAALAHNGRSGKSAVFDGTDNAARVNLDYAVETGSTLYLGREIRRGDIVSTGSPTLENIDIAKVFAQDDAFPGGQLYSYRFDGETVLTTLGYNIGFGPRDSLDISWRRAEATPDNRPAFATSPSSYVSNQYSIVYLLSF